MKTSTRVNRIKYQTDNTSGLELLCDMNGVNKDRYPALYEFMEDWNVDASLPFDERVVKYLLDGVDRYRTSTVKVRTHTMKPPSGPMKNAPYAPLDLAFLVKEQPAYADFVRWLTNHPELCMAEVGTEFTYRFLIDLDTAPTGNDQQQQGFSQRTIKAFCERVNEYLGLRSNGYYIFFHTKESPSGCHIIFPNVLVDPKEMTPAKWDTLWSDINKIADEIPHLKTLWTLDRQPTLKGTLRMPFQNHPIGAPSTASRRAYSLFVTADGACAVTGAMVQGSLLLVDQARNPIALHNIPSLSAVVTRNAPRPQPTESAPQPVTPQPVLVQDSERVDLAEMLSKNNPLHFKSMTDSYAYGTDFIEMREKPILPLQLLTELTNHLTQNISNGWTEDDVKSEIVKIMNNHFAYIRSGLIVYRSYNVTNDAFTFAQMTEKDFHLKFSAAQWKFSVSVTDKNGVTRKTWKSFALSQIWLKHIARRTYQDAIFSPYPKGHPCGHKWDQINLFKGWRWTPEELKEAVANATPAEKATANLFQSHIHDVICDGDGEKFQFFMCYLAKKTQEPWFRPDSCFVITGPEGSGKSVVFEKFLVFAGENGAKCTDIHNLFGTFNSTFKNKTIIFIDEGSWAGAVKANTQLKNFITSSTYRSEQKYRDMEERCNYCCIVVVSNDRVVMKQGQAARRYLFYPVRPNSSRGRQAEHHKYFTEMHKLDDNDYAALKVWLSQFYDFGLYAPSLLKQYANFGNHFFPKSCFDEMERQKCFSHNSVTKYWERVILRGYTYPPFLDYNLNSYDPLDFTYEHRLDATALVIPNGRCYEDLEESAPEMKLYPTLEEMMAEIRNPTWSHKSHWLATMNVQQLYAAYLEMKKIDLVPQKGLEENVDLSSFLFHTKCIFNSLIGSRSECSEFRYTIKAEWQARSLARLNAKTDADWRSEHRDTSRSSFMDQPMTILTLGSLEDCAEAFYVFSGLDLSPDKKFKNADVGTRPSLYDEDWVASCVKIFQ